MKREFVCEKCGRIVSLAGHLVQDVLPDRVACASACDWSDTERPRSAMAWLAVSVLVASRKRCQDAINMRNRVLNEIGDRVQRAFYASREAA